MRADGTKAWSPFHSKLGLYFDKIRYPSRGNSEASRCTYDKNGKNYWFHCSDPLILQKLFVEEKAVILVYTEPEETSGLQEF